MVSVLPRRRLALALPIALGSALLAGMVAHEEGHAATAMLFSQPIHSVGVVPGVELYPRLRRVPWDGWIAYVDHGEPPRPWQAGLCKFMGGGTTALLAYGWVGAAFYVGRCRPVAPTFLLAAGVVFAWDILMYATMPLLGLRHAVFIGGADPEPLLGARLMGMPAPLVWLLLAAHFVTFHVLVWRLLRPLLRRGRREAAA